MTQSPPPSLAGMHVPNGRVNLKKFGVRVRVHDGLVGEGFIEAPRNLLMRDPTSLLLCITGPSGGKCPSC